MAYRTMIFGGISNVLSQPDSASFANALRSRGVSVTYSAVTHDSSRDTTWSLAYLVSFGIVADNDSEAASAADGAIGSFFNSHEISLTGRYELTLNIPQSQSRAYTVQRGDTLATIARRFNTTVAAIASLNGISNPNRISVGQVLQIPNRNGVPQNTIPGSPSLPPPRPAPAPQTPPQPAPQTPPPDAAPKITDSIDSFITGTFGYVGWGIFLIAGAVIATLPARRK